MFLGTTTAFAVDDGTLGLLLLRSTYAFVVSYGSVPLRGSDTVTALQAIVLGMMLGWTPGMVLFAYFLWRDTGPLPVRERDRDGILPESALNPAQLDTRLREV